MISYNWRTGEYEGCELAHVVFQWDGPHGDEPSIIAVFHDKEQAKQHADYLNDEVIDTGWVKAESVPLNPPLDWLPYD